MAGDKITERFIWVRRPHLVSAQCLVQALDTHLLPATGRMVEIQTGFPPGFFFVLKTCHDALSTKTRDKVSVSVFVTVVSVKMRQKHLVLLESSRGPPHHVQTDTCLVSDHTTH